MQENEIYSQVISTFTTVLNKYSLYPSNHPVIKNNIFQAHRFIQKVLENQKDFNFSVSPEGKVLVNDQPIENLALGLSQNLVAGLKRIEVEGVTFYQGLTLDELKDFINIMLLKPDDLKKMGGISQAINDKSISHIRVNIYSYIKVDKDKEVVVVGKDQLGGAGGFKQNINDYLEGKLEGASLQDTGTQLYRRFLEAPDEVLRIFKDFLLNAPYLARLLDILGEAIITDTKDKAVSSRIESAKSLIKFAAQLKKVSSDSCDKDQAAKVNALIEEKSGKYAYGVVIDAAVSEIKEKKGWTPVLTNIFRKIFTRPQDKERLAVGLKEALSAQEGAQGIGGNIIARIDEELSKVPQVRSRGSGIDKKEFDELKKENALLRERIDILSLQMKDAEEMKRRHKVVLDEKERIESIVHHMAEGLVVLDPEGNVLLINPAAEELLGVGKEEALGGNLRSYIKDEHLLTVTKDLIADGEGGLNKEIELLSPDESTKRVLKTSSAVIENQDGRTVGMVTVLNDITRQKELEKLKSDFVSNVSHELRTPLVVIQHSLAILSAEVLSKLNDDQKQFFTNAENNLSRLRVLINDLLDMSAIEAGKFRLKCEMININEVARGVVDFLNKWAQRKNITLEFIPLPSEAEVFMDKDKITQVITNLLGNSIKFTPDGGKVCVSLAGKGPGEGLDQAAVEVSIIDNGIGIEPKDMERIFAKFEQVSLSQPSGVSGTGLGLPIAKEIVYMHRGKIWVESEPGKGSKFTFLLPSAPA